MTASGHLSQGPALYPHTPYDTPAVFSCSPRAGGNSDHAGEYFSEGIHQAGGRCNVHYLRHFNIHPCVGCLRCSRDPHGDCFLTDLDQSGPLFQILISAPMLFIAAPIYFYHLPAQFKSWIDRSQSYYLRRENKDQRLVNLPSRPAVTCLVAGRRQGDKLFAGAQLTLKYFLRTFNFQIRDQLSFRGMDAADALQGHHPAKDSLVAAGAAAWRSLTSPEFVKP